jgi:hydrogenase maturation protease
VDLLEALTLCQALDKVPDTVILGAEPADIDTINTELTPVLQERVDKMVQTVLSELDQLGVSYQKRSNS